VAALYAHHSAFPQALSSPQMPEGAAGEPLTAVEVLRRFNSPNGVAHSMAGMVANRAVSDAGRHGRRELVDRFAVHGNLALQQLRQAQATMVVPWPAAGAVVTLGEAVRIVLLEATVHLLDVQRALDHPPLVPALALKDTAQLLVELVPDSPRTEREGRRELLSTQLEPDDVIDDPGIRVKSQGSCRLGIAADACSGAPTPPPERA
jgi:hypothetical protein